MDIQLYGLGAQGFLPLNRQRALCTLNAIVLANGVDEFRLWVQARLPGAALPSPEQRDPDLFPGATVGKSSDTSPVRYKDMYEYDSDDGGGMSQPPPRKTASLPWTRFT
eukprot:CAMPEP_0114242460 /NCGR_PEP_ID=MMETSP0058-20121206/10188_1 /TAXON_ID=36894 /ORGANISM="Pyramimonas parkeae, CCMP726" /LENGTH=108 /DNA_ID=CAMNT_0001355075 /DNA_START=380 /DNA_END=704 /DNA_ORIENTATION=+